MINKFTTYLLLLASLSLFILSACEKAEKNKSYQLIRSEHTLAFALDEQTKNVTPFLSYYRDKKGKEYIVLQSYSMQFRSNKFYFYDKDSQKLAFKIEPEREGPNGVGRIVGCYIQDWDSLYLTSLFEPEIIRINKNCQIQEKINYEKADDGTRLYYDCFGSFKPATLIGRDLYIYSSPNRLIEKDYVSATINLDTKEIKALPFVYPDYPGSSVKLKRYGLEGSYSRSFDGERFVYSFIYDESVYVANIAHDSIRKVPVKSEYIDQIQLPDELTAQAIDFCQNALYGNLIYDPYREVFYRIAYPATTIEKGVRAMELSEYGRKNFSIIILDKELNKLGETLFPDYTYNSRQLLVLPDGLYLCNSHFMNPDFNDDILSFVRYDLVPQRHQR